ncbi:MAG: type II secretion system protein GspM [Pontibacterium sp.]
MVSAKSVSKAWNNLSRRERVLITVTAAVLPLMLLFIMVLEPALNRLQGVDSHIESLQRSVSAQQRLLTVLQNAEIPDPDIKARQDLQAMVARLEALNANLEHFASKLVSPEQMLGLLHSVLGTEKGLKVLEAYSLPVEPLILITEQADEAPGTREASADERARALQDAVIYIHYFEMRLEGDYQALYLYLQRLEQLHQGFFWDKLEYQSEVYPNAQIRLRVHTLSTEESWLGA